MNYKVCILAAGIGSRMGAVTDHLNKALLPVNFKAVISHIIEKFDKNIEVVIAVGHKKETIIDYLTLAYPERKFTFVEVDKYLGPGTGPGHSLLQCKNHLRSPFVFFTSDTLVVEEIPQPDKNWFGIAPVKDTENYCTVKIKNNLICQLEDKVKTDNKYAFIGLAGVYDYGAFFDALETNKAIRSNEIQVSNGFNALIENTLVPQSFTWFDTGTYQNYQETNKNFLGGIESFDFNKTNEFLYFVNGRVIKYFADQDIIEKRYERANFLKGLCPILEGKKGNFYSYKRIDGQVLYDILNPKLMNDFLHWSKSNLWKKKTLTDLEHKRFKEACKKFYLDKTSERLNKFYLKTGVEDNLSIINGVSIPTLAELFSKIDLQLLTDGGIPSLFHGDLQFDNVLVTKDEKSNLDKFVLLDWRQDFGGIIEYGDLYYDLAKLYGGLSISYKQIKTGQFSFDCSGTSVYYRYNVTNDLVEAKEEYEKFIKKNSFDLKKIRILTGLIFLNMACMHNDPFDLLLYYLGKMTLYKALELEGGKEIK